MQICFFEDKLYTNFHPLTLTRPVDDLRVGILTIAGKWVKAFQAKNTVRLVRDEIKGVFKDGEIDEDKSCLWINARYLPSRSLITRVKDLALGNCLQMDDTVIAAHVGGSDSKKWHKKGQPNFHSLFVIEAGTFASIHHLWDLFTFNGNEIQNDIGLLNPNRSESADISDFSAFENKSEIFIEDSVSIEAGCILDARKGPIYIGEGATIMAGSIIYGPAAICEKATIKAGAKIYEGSTIGPVCKVGGEVNNTIFHSYSNKAHDGFVGNSIFGQWCNLGADTNTSNLKNNYSTIRIVDWDTEEEMETDQQFFGTVMGDHSKTAINTQLNTGTLCGVSSNIFSSDFPPKFIPSFSWVGSNVIQTYKPEKALETMKTMMARRDVVMSDAYNNMMRHISKNSRHRK